jgi:hypothetical protein
MQPGVGTLEYVVEVAKDWTLARFAAAQASDFALAPHRFEFCGNTVQRHPIPPQSAEGRSPFDAVRRTQQPTAWSHSAVLTVLAGSEADPVQYEQEIIEILALDDADVLAECAFVVRIEGLPPCLGPFWSGL